MTERSSRGDGKGRSARLPFALSRLLTALLVLLPFPVAAATMAPVRMKMIDAEDGSPVQGAHVLFQANAREGTLTGHGGRSANLFVAEALTDVAGEFRFPKQDFSSQPFFLNTVYLGPSMVVLKPGYVLVVLTDLNRLFPTLKELTTWQYSNQTIKMKRLTTEDEVVQSLDSAVMYAEMPASEKNPCFWKQYPRFLVSLDRLVKEWEGKRATVADTSLRNRRVANPLQKILMNEQFFVEQGCSPPRAFFEPYGR